MYNAIVGQSGGPTAAINATLAGVITAAVESPNIGTLFGAQNGIEGILDNRILDLGKLFEKNDGSIDLLKLTPAAALGSCRVKLPAIDDKERSDVYRRIFDRLKENNIGYFFYIGGNDSMDTVDKLSALAKDYGAGYMRFIGVPKTIDNDICETDHTPGYGSAAKYIAATMQSILYDCAVYTVKSVTIVEIMGRDSGWLACSAAVPRLNGMAPDYVYLPEVPFSTEKFVSDITNAHKLHPNVVVAVSEGIRFADGRYVGESNQNGVTDVFGHKYLAGAGKTLEMIVKNEIGCKVRSFDLSLPQRCASFALSQTDIDESFGVGRFAVEAAIDGESGVFITYVRHESPYRVTYKPIKIDKVANRVKQVPSEFINADGNNVTDACIDYIVPLISGQPKIEYLNGIPAHYKIK